MFDKFVMWIAWKLPKDLVKWASIRLMSNATFVHSSKTPEQISIMEALKSW
jgi:hypothetical protein